MRKALYLFYVPLLLIEWAIDLACAICTAIHKAFETLTLSTEKYINEPAIKETAK
jgi:hypothetical protein